MVEERLDCFNTKITCLWLKVGVTTQLFHKVAYGRRKVFFLDPIITNGVLNKKDEG